MLPGRIVCYFVALLSALILCSKCYAQSEPRPNILVIVTDDQRYDDMTAEFMPQTKSRIFDQGITFSKGYVTTPTCCPSRSSIMTGLYASQHAVRNNDYILKKETFADRLHSKGGYYTGLIGKFLNTWDGSPRPAYDYWVSISGGAVSYFNPVLNYNGEKKIHPGYTTYLFRDAAMRFFDAAKKSGKPWLLQLNFNAPHASADPAPADSKRFVDVPLAAGPDFMEQDLSDKPLWLRRLHPLDDNRILRAQNFRIKQRQCLWSTDQAIGTLLDRLQTLGMLDNTAIFFISDNGILAGEHGIYVGKDVVYEEAIHVPFALRYPPLIPSPQTNDKLVANIDIAPTIFELSGTAPTSPIAGRSLLDLIRGSGEPWRSELLIEAFREDEGRTPFEAVHTERYVFARNRPISGESDATELYDLLTDPYQLNNLTDDPAMAEIRSSLESRLDVLLLTYRGGSNFNLPKGIKIKKRVPVYLTRNKRAVRQPNVKLDI